MLLLHLHAAATPAERVCVEAAGGAESRFPSDTPCLPYCFAGRSDRNLANMRRVCGLRNAEQRGHFRDCLVRRLPAAAVCHRHDIGTHHMLLRRWRSRNISRTDPLPAGAAAYMLVVPTVTAPLASAVLGADGVQLAVVWHLVSWATGSTAGHVTLCRMSTHHAIVYTGSLSSSVAQDAYAYG